MGPVSNATCNPRSCRGTTVRQNNKAMTAAKTNGTTAMKANPSTITGPVMGLPHPASFYAVRIDAVMKVSFPEVLGPRKVLKFCCQSLP